MKIIELFAGIGTQYQAFKDNSLNIEVPCISEIDARPLKAYTALHGQPNNWGDITKIKSLPQADIWTYSFPCTDLSIAGKQIGFSGKHSSLIYEVYRLLEVSPKPKILLMENVANIVSEKFKSQFQEWINALIPFGYVSTWKKIKAFNYGGATSRERVFMVSVLNDKPFIFPSNCGTTKTLADFLEPIDNNYLIASSNLIDLRDPCYSATKKLADYKNGGQGNRIYSTKAQGVTLTASGGGHAGSSGGLYLRDGNIYKLSPIEMCKVMGWTKKEAEIICSVLSPREVGFCLGNAIDRTVLSILAKSIIEQYNLI